MKIKKERSTYLYNCFQQSRITRQDSTEKIFHQWKLNNHQVNVDDQHTFFFFDLSVYKLELHASQVKLRNKQCKHIGILMIKGSDVRMHLV